MVQPMMPMVPIHNYPVESEGGGNDGTFKTLMVMILFAIVIAIVLYFSLKDGIRLLAMQCRVRLT